MQSWLNRTPFEFDPTATNEWSSARHYQGSYQIHLVYDPQHKPALAFKFFKDGRETLSVDGFPPFVIKGDVAYFVEYQECDSGGLVKAYDLVSGKLRWSTELVALEHPSHFNHSTEMNISVVDRDDLNPKAAGFVRVAGHELYGDYVELLDQKTGELLARRVYRVAGQRSQRERIIEKPVSR